MSQWIAALPMYDWPERRAEVDAEWATIRHRLRAAGVDAPEALTRVHDDLLDFWKRPDLLFAQTCWGPMNSAFPGMCKSLASQAMMALKAAREFYSSAIVMRRDASTSPLKGEGGSAALLLDRLRGARLAYNVPDSMSGIIGLTRDLEAVGESLATFSDRIETGGHRKSIRAVADGAADVAAIDCMSWHLAKLYEPAAKELEVVGWTAKRKGLPFITANSTPLEVVAALKAAVSGN